MVAGYVLGAPVGIGSAGVPQPEEPAMSTLRALLPLAGLAVGLLLATGCREPRETAPVLALTGDLERGAAKYQMVCAGCHGTEGYGIHRAPALVKNVGGLDDEQVVHIMLNGRGGMPAKRITDQEAADILAWMRSAWGPEDPEGASSGSSSGEEAPSPGQGGEAGEPAASDGTTSGG